VYQNSRGGKTYVPLEIEARIIRDASPRLAKQVSSKYSNSSAKKVQMDLNDNHARHISQDYIQNLAQEVGVIIEKEEVVINYKLPSKVIDSKLVSIGRDGTTMHIRGEKYRETMNGTISFYNEESERIHTIYLAQAPEYKKPTFNKRFMGEINKVKSQLSSDAKYIGLADGAAENWTFLDPITDESILDYWHACEYLTKAGKASSRSRYERKKWSQDARDVLKNKEGSAQDLLEEMKGFKRKKKLSKVAKENLKDATTYFTNHHHQMDYAGYLAKNYPIGSGVTEAACKVITKERLCQSGMKWKTEGAQKLLSIRALHHTDGRWAQFWKHIDNFGFALN